ncbi:hypothetical protein GCM10010358_38280 [Streptomyces minutiscleroticus]|uniref:Uncharacterized protein n=1 Tax=Streptomyces minutiscleroticus TaxID=68238 RepID=A0A918NM42_9ACTN|nr:hypothetical protein GCM10010358_38280 [Streptomyces minutiscleroticus]
MSVAGFDGFLGHVPGGTVRGTTPHGAAFSDRPGPSSGQSAGSSGPHSLCVDAPGPMRSVSGPPPVKVPGYAKRPPKPGKGGLHAVA